MVKVTDTTRTCFSLLIEPGSEERYDRLHREMGAAMEEAVDEAGLSNYTLFRKGTMVIGYVETVGSFDRCLAQLQSSTSFQEWASQFGDVFAGGTNLAELTTYEEVWHVD